MPNPRTRHSKSRTRKRRTHDHAGMPQLALCKKTGETHVYHQAYQVDGDTFYRGRLLIKARTTTAKA
jgi:large subunit ribosomal protein L32